MERVKRHNPFKIAYKVLAILLVGFGVVYGLLMPVPNLPMLGETWRNLLYHVPMWYVQIVILMTSAWFSIQFLRSQDLQNDMKASQAAHVGLLFGFLGLVTGIVWSRVTWNAASPSNSFAAWWSWDPKQIFALILQLIYLAYFLLRDTFNEPVQKARISAVYNIFGAAMIIPMYYVIPRIMGGLHPGSGDEGIMSTIGNLSSYRIIFYPVVLGFILLGFWVWELRVRAKRLGYRINELEEE